MTIYIRLVYCSKFHWNEIDSNIDKKIQIQDIVDKSNVKNKINKIGGDLFISQNLLYTKQILEGEKGLVLKLYDKILNDDRHEIRVMKMKHIDKHLKRYKNWGMKVRYNTNSFNCEYF